MTIKLYEQDPYLQVFDATVLSCTPHECGFAVVLDQTAFFPEGGGQPADGGTLGEATVRDVQIKNGIIVHTVDKALDVGQTVRGAIDWETRFARMQHHTGEHLLSGVLHRLYGVENVGFHLNDTLVTLDTSLALSSEQLADAERTVNRAVQENRRVTAAYPSSEELPTLTYRSKLNLTEGVRLVTIEGYDVCACCAPHVATTGEIGVLKIIGAMSYKGGMRLTMVCGMRAFEDYATLHNANGALMSLLSAPREQVAAFAQREHDTLDAMRAEIKQLQDALALSRLEIVTSGTTVCGFTQDATADALRVCAETVKRPDSLCAVFSLSADGTVSYLLVNENGDVRDTVKALNVAFDGKGGGKPTMAQGRLRAERDALLAFFSER